MKSTVLYLSLSLNLLLGVFAVKCLYDPISKKAKTFGNTNATKYLTEVKQIPKAPISKTQFAFVSTKRHKGMTEGQIEAKLIRETPIPKHRIVFIGDSHTDFFPESLLSKEIVKQGIAGDTTEGALKRIDRLVDSEPEKVFIEMGFNDITRDFAPADIAARIIKIAKRFNKSKVYINALFPSQTLTYSGKTRTRPTHETNKKLKAECIKNGYTFIDMVSILQKGNRLNPAYDCSDWVHLNYKGYQAWATQLNKHL